MPFYPEKRKDSEKWWIRGSYKGHRYFKNSGIAHGGAEEPPLKVKKLCEQRQREFQDEIDEGGSETFGAAVRLYLNTGGSPRFLGPIEARFKGTPLRDMTQAMIDKAAIEIYPDCTPATRNRQFYTPFIAVWSKASQGQKAMCNHVKWGRPKGSTTLRQVRKPVDYKDAVKFINACPDHSGKIMFFLFWTGCRPLEAITAKCENVDIKKQWMVLEDTKTGEPRGIPLHKSLIPMLKEEVKKGGILFRTSEGKPYADNRSRNGLGRIVSQGGGNFTASMKPAQKLGLGITPYTARHTVSTYLAGKVTTYEKDAILGHARGISGHYVHLPQTALIQAINNLPNAEKLGCRFSNEVYNACTKQSKLKTTKRGKTRYSKAL